MGWPTGRTKPKTGGRRRGVPNRPSQELRQALDGLGLNVPLRIAQLLPKLSAKEEAAVLVKLLEFIYPRRKAVEIELDSPCPITRQFEGMSDAVKRERLKTVVGRLTRRLNRVEGLEEDV